VPAALGQGTGEDGLHVKQLGTGQFVVHGAVFSNSNINIVNGTMSTNTSVYARGACSGLITSTPAAICNYGATVNPRGNDPGYAKQTTTVPAYQPLPACTTPNSVITFRPGYYDDAVGLSTMMKGNSACKGSTWWFTPGVYYFDFHNSGGNADPALPSGANVWTINDGYLVGGTPVNSAGTIVSAPSNPAILPGACDNPINDQNAVGVQFILGNDSQVVVSGGQSEICGSYSLTTPPVAFYGNTSGAETTTTLTGLTTLTASTVTSTGPFTNATTTALAGVEKAYAAGTYATWTPISANTITDQLSVSGFAPPTAIHAGANLVSATLRVGHRFNPNGGTGEALTIAVTPNSGGAFTVSVPAYRQTLPAGQVDAIDVTSTMRTVIHGNGFSGATMTAQATISKKGTQDIDGLQLDLTYIAPAFRAESGCVTTVPYTGGGSSCAALTGVNNFGVPFYVQGTTYVPAGVVDITLNNAATWVFRFGVIARAFWIKETGSLAYTGPIIEVPDDTPGFVFNVFLSVYLCPTSATCTVPTGTPTPAPALSARVAFVDGSPALPVAGQRQVAVLSWSSTR
jgi:hypothetical protein